MSIEEVIAKLKAGNSAYISSHSKVCGVISPKQATDMAEFIAEHEQFEMLVDRPERIEHFTDNLPDAAWDLLDLNQELLQLSFVVKRGLPTSVLNLKSIPFRVIRSKEGADLVRKMNGVLLLAKPKGNPKPEIAIDLLFSGKCEQIGFDEAGRILI